VVISGITPSGYNGTYTVASASTNTFTVALASSPGAYSGGGGVASTTASATLNVVAPNAITVGTSFTILSAASVTGTFNGLANGTIINVGAQAFQIAYTSTAVTLTAVTPAASVALTGGLAG